MKAFRASLAWLSVFACACGGEPSPSSQADEDEAAESALWSPCTYRDGTENYDGIAGDYERVGWLRTDEIRSLTVSQVTPDGRQAHYERRLKKSCAAPGCDEDEGTMSMLPDNAAFTNNFAFYPTGATQPSDMVFVLGIQRTAGVVTEMCVARVVTARDVRMPFALRRVGP